MDAHAGGRKPGVLARCLGTRVPGTEGNESWEEGSMTKKNAFCKDDGGLSTYTSLGTGIGTAAGAGFIVPLGPAAPVMGAIVGSLLGLAVGLVRNRGER